MKKNELISILELTKQLNVAKSTLHYYISLGLIQPIYSAKVYSTKGHGGMYLFNRKKILQRWEIILKKKATGLTLEEIAAKIK